MIRLEIDDPHTLAALDSVADDYGIAAVDVLAIAVSDFLVRQERLAAKEAAR